MTCVAHPVCFAVPAVDRACVDEEATIAMALRILEGRAVSVGPLLSEPDVAGRFFRLRLGTETREHFEVAFWIRAID